MSQRDAPQEPTPQEIRIRRNNADRILQLVALGADRGWFSPLITVVVGGLSISGRAVSTKEYFDGVVSQLRGDTDLRALLGSIGANYPTAAEQESAKIVGTEHEYLRLSEARAFAPGGHTLPTDQGVWFEVKIASIDAYFFGALAAQPVPGGQPLFAEGPTTTPES